MQLTRGREVGIDVELIRRVLAIEANRRAIFLAPGDRDAPCASDTLTEVRVLSLLDPQGSLHQGQRRRTFTSLGPVRRVADSRGTRNADEHPAGFRRSLSLVSAGSDPGPRLCGRTGGGGARSVLSHIGNGRPHLAKPELQITLHAGRDRKHHPPGTPASSISRSNALAILLSLIW